MLSKFVLVATDPRNRRLMGDLDLTEEELNGQKEIVAKFDAWTVMNGLATWARYGISLTIREVR